MQRKLASIRMIDSINPIDGADAIEVAQVGGWQVVVKKGEFKAGELAVYIEIDSWVPSTIAPFLTKDGHFAKVFNGIEGERLRTIRLRKQLSQGLLLPVEHFVKYLHELPCDEGCDVTEALGIQKWERPLAPELQGQAKGNFPQFIRKTDQERIQNIRQRDLNSDDLFEVTEKLDGSSMTVYFNTEHACWEDGEAYAYPVLGVCSRNLELDMTNENNAYIRVATDTGLLNALYKLGRNIAVQGELYGDGIQGNNEAAVGQHFAVYDIWDIDNQCYFNREARWSIYGSLRDLGWTGFHIPVVHEWFRLGDNTVASLLAMAEGKNNAGNEREGLVFKRVDGQFSFKAISNKFLLKGGD